MEKVLKPPEAGCAFSKSNPENKDGLDRRGWRLEQALNVSTGPLFPE